MKVNLNKIQSDNFYDPKEDVPYGKLFLKIMVPALVGGTLMRGLYETAVKSSVESVATMALTTLSYTPYVVVGIGALALYKAYDSYNAEIQKRASYVQIPRSEYKKLEKELIRLRELEIQAPFKSSSQASVDEEKHLEKKIDLAKPQPNESMTNLCNYHAPTLLIPPKVVGNS